MHTTDDRLTIHRNRDASLQGTALVRDNFGDWYETVQYIGWEADEVPTLFAAHLVRIGAVMV